MKQTLAARAWSDDVDGALTVDAVSRRHQPSSRHRISSSTYPPETCFTGITREATVYVLRGKCRYEFADAVLVVSEHEFADVPAGQFTFEVIGDREFIGLTVWPLPFDIDSAPSFRVLHDVALAHDANQRDASIEVATAQLQARLRRENPQMSDEEIGQIVKARWPRSGDA